MNKPVCKGSHKGHLCVLASQGQDVGFIVLDDQIVAVGFQDFARFAFELGRDQYFFHFLPPSVRVIYIAGHAGFIGM